MQQREEMLGSLNERVVVASKAPLNREWEMQEGEERQFCPSFDQRKQRCPSAGPQDSNFSITPAVGTRIVVAVRARWGKAHTIFNIQIGRK